MKQGFHKIQEIAPSGFEDGLLLRDMEYVISEDIGAIDVVTSDGRSLGEMDLGG